MPNLFWFATVLFKIFGKFGYRCVVFACDVKSCQTLYYQELPAHTDHGLEAFLTTNAIFQDLTLFNAIAFLPACRLQGL